MFFRNGSTDELQLIVNELNNRQWLLQPCNQCYVIKAQFVDIISVLLQMHSPKDNILYSEVIQEFSSCIEEDQSSKTPKVHTLLTGT